MSPLEKSTAAIKFLIAAARDVSADVIADGRAKIMPSSFYADMQPIERLALGARHGLYSLPTEELVAWLREAIGGRSAIEIGSGTGILAQALGIPATDNHQQLHPAIAAHTRASGREPIRYGANVERLSAAEAVAKYKPQVVVASWVTHMLNPDRMADGGNPLGVDEEEIIRSCDEYIFIGNEAVHSKKPIWALPHQKLHPSWLHAASLNGSPEFIARWKRTA